MPFYAADGSINVTVVDGSVYTGLYANNGSYNVKTSSGSTYVGVYHPCGALNVTVAPTVSTVPNPIRAPDGSLNVSISPYTNGGRRVTVISGSLGTPLGFVAKGDSLTIGTGLAGNYPSDMSRIVGIPVIQNYGVGGQTVATANANYAAEGGSSFNASTANTYLFMMGTNEAQPAATILSRIQTHLNLALATGYKIALGTITKRGDNAPAQAENDIVNASIRANYLSMGATWLMDFDQWPTLQNPNDTTYYNADKLHFVDAGWLEMAKCAKAGMSIPALSTRGVNGALRLTANPPGYKSSGAVPVMSVPTMQTVTLGNGSIVTQNTAITTKSVFAFSFTSGVTNFTNVGVVTAADVNIDMGFGPAGTGGAGWYQNAGVFTAGASPNNGLGGFTNGDTVGCVVDPTAKQIWWTKDGINFIGINSLATLAQVNAGTNSTAQTWTAPVYAACGLWGGSNVVANSVIYPTNWTLPTGYTQL